jgi:hypothetical protein
VIKTERRPVNHEEVKWTEPKKVEMKFGSILEFDMMV